MSPRRSMSDNGEMAIPPPGQRWLLGVLVAGFISSVATTVGVVTWLEGRFVRRAEYELHIQSGHPVTVTQLAAIQAELAAIRVEISYLRGAVAGREQGENGTGSDKTQ